MAIARATTAPRTLDVIFREIEKLFPELSDVKHPRYVPRTSHPEPAQKALQENESKVTEPTSLLPSDDGAQEQITEQAAAEDLLKFLTELKRKYEASPVDPDEIERFVTNYKNKLQNSNSYGQIIFKCVIAAINIFVAGYLLSCMLLPSWIAYIVSGAATVIGFKNDGENKVLAGTAMLLGIYGGGASLSAFGTSQLTAYATSAAVTTILAGIANVICPSEKIMDKMIAGCGLFKKPSTNFTTKSEYFVNLANTYHLKLKSRPAPSS